MERLTKKTTILLSSDMHERLTHLAEHRGTSLGHLIRDACETTYGLLGREERTRAVRSLLELELPIGAPSEMKRESVPAPDDLLP